MPQEDCLFKELQVSPNKGMEVGVSRVGNFCEEVSCVGPVFKGANQSVGKRLTLVSLSPIIVRRERDLRLEHVGKIEIQENTSIVNLQRDGDRLHHETPDNDRGDQFSLGGSVHIHLHQHSHYHQHSHAHRHSYKMPAAARSSPSDVTPMSRDRVSDIAMSPEPIEKAIGDAITPNLKQKHGGKVGQGKRREQSDMLGSGTPTARSGSYGVTRKFKLRGIDIQDEITQEPPTLEQMWMGSVKKYDKVPLDVTEKQAGTL